MAYGVASPGVASKFPCGSGADQRAYFPDSRFCNKPPAGAPWGADCVPGPSSWVAIVSAAGKVRYAVTDGRRAIEQPAGTLVPPQPGRGVGRALRQRRRRGEDGDGDPRRKPCGKLAHRFQVRGATVRHCLPRHAGLASRANSRRCSRLQSTPAPGLHCWRRKEFVEARAARKTNPLPPLYAVLD